VRHAILTAALAAIVAGTLGCGTLRNESATPSAARPERQYVVVRNTNVLDVAVYAVRYGTRQRIGTVTGLSTGRLALPPSFVNDGSVQLLVDPIGSDQVWLTDPIRLAPTQNVELSVMRPISMSTFSLRNF
jgi:hypothetical protein